jgi:trehalose synthase-fused probable maltokinase
LKIYHLFGKKILETMTEPMKIDWNNLSIERQVYVRLEDIFLPPYIAKCRWFAGKSRNIQRLKIKHAIPLSTPETLIYFVIFEVFYTEGVSENYLLPISYLIDIQGLNEKAIIVEVLINDQKCYLIDAIYDARFRSSLFQNIGEEKSISANNNKLVFNRGKAMTEEKDFDKMASEVPPIDSSNSAMIFGEPPFGKKYFLKLYRKLFKDTNPEVEMVEFMTQNSEFRNIPRFAGSLTWKREKTQDVTLGMMVEVIENEKDSWSKTGDYLNDFIFAFVDGNFQIQENVFDKVALLAKRTAEMHDALYAPRAKEAFCAEPFDRAYRRYIHKRFEDLLEKRYALLIENYQKIDAQAQELAWIFMESKDLIDEFIDQILTRPIDSLRTRIHGDYHLGQVLVQNEDFMIIDFEGEPESSIADRKIKHSPLKDVAGMIRSYHYAVSAKLFNAAETEGNDPVILQRAADRWYKLIKDTYLEEYFNYFGFPHPLFKNNNEINYLLLFYLLEKAVYELGYELNSRPTWVKIPLRGIVDVIREMEKMKM